MTDSVGTVEMFPQPPDPKTTKHMERMDVRLPTQVVGAVDASAFRLGISTSEFLRLLIIDGLERRRLL